MHAIYQLTDTQTIKTTQTPDWRAQLEEDARQALLKRNALEAFQRDLRHWLKLPNLVVTSFDVVVHDLRFIYTRDLKVFLRFDCWKCHNELVDSPTEVQDWNTLVAAYNERHTLCPACAEKERPKKD